MTATTFTAQIKQITQKQLVSGDTSVRVLLELDAPNSEKISAINNVNSINGVEVTLNPTNG